MLKHDPFVTYKIKGKIEAWVIEIFSCDRASPVRRANFIATAHNFFCYYFVF